MTTYIVFGDSIARGAYDPKIGGWVSHLAKLIESNYGDKVYNMGVSGETTSDLLKRLSVEISARNPDTIIIAIGINDTRQMESGSPTINIEIFTSNLEKILRICNGFVKNIIFVGITRVDEKVVNPWKDKGFYYNKIINKYDAIIENFATSHDLIYIPMSDILRDSDLYDGLHPNEIGHKKMFDRVISRIF